MTKIYAKTQSCLMQEASTNPPLYDDGRVNGDWQEWTYSEDETKRMASWDFSFLQTKPGAGEQRYLARTAECVCDEMNWD